MKPDWLWSFTNVEISKVCSPCSHSEGSYIWLVDNQVVELRLRAGAGEQKSTLAREFGISLSGDYHYILLLNPILVIERHYVGRTNDVAFSSLLGRLTEVGADDLDL